MRTLDVNDIKDVSLAPDTNLASLTLVTKYAGDLGITLPVASLKALQVLFRSSAANGAPAEQQSAKLTGQRAELAIAVAQKWLVAADKKRGLAVIVSNQGTPVQTGFALRPKEARDLAAALLKQADALEATATPSRA